MLAKLTLLGLTEYNSEKVWEHFSLPEGVDQEIAKRVILDTCGELPLLHPDLDYINWRVGVFCSQYRWTFEKWKELLDAEYDPLVNYDRTESWTDTEEHADESSTSGHSGVSAETTNTHKVSAYNESTFQNAIEDRTVNTSSGSTSGTNESSGDSTSTHTGTVKGNIGVTTSQAMWEAQAKLVTFNIYKNIATLFKQEFCLGIYV